MESGPEEPLGESVPPEAPQRERNPGGLIYECINCGSKLPPPPVARLADWVEQLVAESTGKGGRGLIPVVDDPVREARADAEIVTDFAADPLDLGAEFLKWQYATWELCERLGVNAFDQPDVEEAKAL